MEVVLEAVMVLLTGKMMTFQDTRRLLNGGEAFLLMLQQFRVEDVTVSTCSRHMLSIHDIAHPLCSVQSITLLSTRILSHSLTNLPVIPPHPHYIPLLIPSPPPISCPPPIFFISPNRTHDYT